MLKLEEQVCGLELAKKLKSLNVKQESLWYYDDSDNLFMWDGTGNPEYEPDWDDCFSAFTASELGEMLPLYLKEDANNGISFSVETSGLQIHKSYDNKRWCISYGGRNESDESETNARAKMLIYLLENRATREETVEEIKKRLLSEAQNVISVVEFYENMKKYLDSLTTKRKDTEG